MCLCTTALSTANIVCNGHIHTRRFNKWPTLTYYYCAMLPDIKKNTLNCKTFRARFHQVNIFLNIFVNDETDALIG